MAQRPEPKPTPLPLAGEPPAIRADAARNRERILAAARKLFSERGMANVSLAEVARAAGVGKGTLFHRFGDRAGLALALLDESERQLQESVLRGPPPLGPGAPPPDRLKAFLSAMLDLLEDHTDLLLAAEAAGPEERFRTPVYASWHTHMTALIAEARPEEDARLLAHLLLAALDAGLIAHLGGAENFDRAKLAAAIEVLAEGALGGASGGA